MKSNLIGFGLLLAMVVSAADTNRLARGNIDVGLRLASTGQPRYPLLVGRQNDPVRIMERLQSETLRDLFPEHTAYRLIITSDPIHGAAFTALLLDTNGVPNHLESDEDVAHFLGALTRDVGSTSNALKLVQAFVALRSYKIVENPPSFKDAREPDKQPAPLASDFKFFAEDLKGEWRVYATLFTSEYSGSYERYIFTIYKTPGAGFHFSEPALVRLRNYVY